MSDLKDPRVLFAAERTLLAWNRTSLSLIAFGFAVERAGVLIHSGPAHAALTFLIGVAFTALGAASAVYSTLQFRAVLRTLGPAEFPPGYGTRWAPALNWLVAAMGASTTLVLFVGRAT